MRVGETIPPGGPPATERALARLVEARAVVLVEGLSDQLALEAVARRRRLDLAPAGVAILPIGGAHAVGRFVERLAHLRLAGLCDAQEAGIFRGALDAPAVHVCTADLEDELLRAHGVEAVESLLRRNGDLAAFRTFQKQPAWRGRPADDQLRRFLTSADRRKMRYATILAATAEQVPAPLTAVLDYAAGPLV
ncbi:MAG TPA: ATP-dependent endonuclease [Gaiellaceae bacterium]|nr:ATP-dependent endonuclease [Gaiellaceae bacterium]